MVQKFTCILFFLFTMIVITLVQLCQTEGLGHRRWQSAVLAEAGWSLHLWEAKVRVTWPSLQRYRRGRHTFLTIEKGRAGGGRLCLGDTEQLFFPPKTPSRIKFLLEQVKNISQYNTECAKFESNGASQSRSGLLNCSLGRPWSLLVFVICLQSAANLGFGN